MITERQAKILDSLIRRPKSISQLAAELKLTEDEVRASLHTMEESLVSREGNIYSPTPYARKERTRSKM